MDCRLVFPMVHRVGTVRNSWLRLLIAAAMLPAYCGLLVAPGVLIAPLAVWPYMWTLVAVFAGLIAVVILVGRAAYLTWRVAGALSIDHVVFLLACTLWGVVGAVLYANQNGGTS